MKISGTWFSRAAICRAIERGFLAAFTSLFHTVAEVRRTSRETPDSLPFMVLENAASPNPMTVRFGSSWGAVRLHLAVFVVSGLYIRKD